MGARPSGGFAQLKARFVIEVFDDDHTNMHTETFGAIDVWWALSRCILAAEKERSDMFDCPVHLRTTPEMAYDVMAWLEEGEFSFLVYKLAEAMARGEVRRAGLRRKRERPFPSDYKVFFPRAAHRKENASGIDARSDETANAGSAVGESPVAKPDAQGITP